MAESVQELSFQNVVDTILKPQGIKVGGYPDNLFINLAEKDREKWQCNICYLILRDVKQCDNKHRFCATCVFAWSMTYGANSDKCPVCRSKQTEYSDDDKYNQEILNCWVKCPEAGCALRCTLQDFLRHSHGMKLYESSSVTALERAKLTRRPAPVNSFVGGTGFVLLPSVLPDQGQGRQTAQGSIREGRTLLQDMMLVLHLEMELRRRALDRFASTSNSSPVNRQERDRHVSEILAIQEQMQEITGFLNILFSITPNHPNRHTRNSLGAADPTDDGSADDSDSSEDAQPSRTSNSTVRISGNRGAMTSNATRTPLERTRYQPATLSTRATDQPSTTPSQLAANGQTNTGSERRLADRISVERLPTDQPRNTASNQLTASLSRDQAASTNQLTASRSRDQAASTNQLTASRSRDQAASTNQLTASLSRDQAVNNNVLANTSSTNLTSGPTTQNQPITEQNETSTSVLPRASSTFRSAMEPLPPLVEATNRRSTSPASSVAAPLAGTSSSSISTSAQAGNLAAPHHRPAPPSGPGRTVNTTRRRRRVIAPSQSNNARAVPPSGESQEPTVQENSTNRQPGPPSESSAVGQSSRATSNRRLNDNGGGSPSSLPVRSGVLLRARRRSEIQQQIHRNMNNGESS